jgi:hypothetical protein
MAVGVNWSPAIGMPFEDVYRVLDEARVDAQDPVILCIHLACPRIEFTDRGKTRVALPLDITAALEKAVRSVTKLWTEQKRQAARDNRVSERALKELERQKKAQDLTVKAAAYQGMAVAYLHASSNRTLPALARMMFYPARPDILRLTGKPSLNSVYFTQRLVPDFIAEHPELTADWDVVFDARGHLIEPHTGRQVDIGGLGVREYMQAWTSDFADAIDTVQISRGCPTYGPANRYRFALFIEKEGFHRLLAAAKIAERYDLAIMSSKGMSSTAARQLVDRLSAEGVTILIAHDFDKSGFEITNTLQTDNHRYTFKNTPRVIDIGLRLDDIKAMGLQSETVEYSGEKDPRISLESCGATPEECAFLVHGKDTSDKYTGERVELNAMNARQFIDWLERKLEAAGARKLVPDEAALQAAYRLADQKVQLQAVIDRAIATFVPQEPVIPPKLAHQVQTTIEGTATSWDEAIWQLATEQRAQRP